MKIHPIRKEHLLILLLLPASLAFLTLIGLFPLGRAMMLLPIGDRDAIYLAVEGCLFGLLISSLEILMVRPLISSPIQWIIWSGVGCGIGWLLGVLASSYAMLVGSSLFGVGGSLSSITFATFVGLSLGGVQSILLRKPAKSRFIWLLANGLGLVFSWQANLSLFINKTEPFAISVLNNASLGLILAMFVLVAYITIAEPSLSEVST